MKLIIDFPVHGPGLEALRALGDHQLHCVPPHEEIEQQVIPADACDADVLFCTMPPKNFADLHRLKWVQIASTGYNQLFGLDLPGRGIRATNSRGCFDVPIAEWNVAMMVNLARHLRGMIRNQEKGVWDRAAVFQREIRGMTIGIWGYGGMGRETARLARNLGLRVHVFARRGVGPRRDVYTVAGTGDPDGVLPDRVFSAGEEQAFLRDLDFLVLALPLTKVTEGLIGERELQALPPRAYVLNPARGPIVNEVALLRALRENWIAGAALDTHYHYPMPPDHPLWAFPNVIMTPHISGAGESQHFRSRLWKIFLGNLQRCVRGEPLLNELTPAQLAGN